jgi:hypothetical protein
MTSTIFRASAWAQKHAIVGNHKIPAHIATSTKHGANPFACCGLGLAKNPKKIIAVNSPAMQMKILLDHLRHVLLLRCTEYDSVKSLSVSAYAICMTAHFLRDYD